MKRILNIFKPKQTPPVNIINVSSGNNSNNKNNNNSTEDLPYYKNDYDKKILEHYNKIREERLKFDKLKLENQELIDYANKRAEREYEVTIKNLNTNKLIIDNLNIFPEKGFSNFEEFMYYFDKNNYLLSEENLVKIVKGFIQFADNIIEEDIRSSQFQTFLDNIRYMCSIIKSEDSFVLISEFFDLYCIEYDELWAIFEDKIVKNINKINAKSIIKIVKHMSNQGEGNEEFYNKIEQKLVLEFDNLELEDLVNIYQSYYNMKFGTVKFGVQLLDTIVNKLFDFKITDSNIDNIIKLCLIANNLNNNLDTQRNKLFELINNKITEYNGYNFKEICLIAHGLGFDNGKKETFNYLLSLIDVKNIENFTFTELNLFIKGFLYSYQITDLQLLKTISDRLFNKSNSF